MTFPEPSGCNLHINQSLRSNDQRQVEMQTGDRVGLPAGEVAVAGTSAAERIAGQVYDAVVIGQVQAQGTISNAGIDGHRVGGMRSADTGDGSAGDTRSSEGEVGGIHAGDGFGES